MGDKETRKRKKRRESAKKEETDDSSPPREHAQDVSGKKKVEDHSSSVNLNEPSILAKVVFCVLFMLLMSAVGLIFYAMNEATRSSEIMEGGVEELVKSTSLPIIDDSPSGESQIPDLISDDEEGHSTLSIDEIINSIEESVTYNVDDDNTGHEDISVDNLNNEEESSNSIQSETLAVSEERQNVESVNERESLTSTETVEDLFLSSALESDESIIPPPSEDVIFGHEEVDNIESTTEMPPIQALNSNPDVIDALDDFDNEGVYESKDNDAEEEPQSLSETMQSNNVQPNSPSQTNEKSEGFISNQNEDHQEFVNEPEENVETVSSQYENGDITNDYDFLFREELDEGDKLIEKSLENALKWFDSLLVRNPKSPRATYAKARILDKMAEERRLNSILENSIEFYKKTMAQPEVPQKLYFLAGNRAVDRLRFRGLVGKALSLQSVMAERFPNDIPIQNQLAVSFMWMGRNSDAKRILRDVLKKDPNSGFAKVHLGFILKIDDNNYAEAIKLLSEGIASKEEGVIDGRFYFHLGDALHRSGFPDKAMNVYEEGVSNGLFLSTLQRSLYNVKGLSGKPWWEPEETPYLMDFQKLEKNWIMIRDEALSLLSDKHKGFEPEAEGLKNTGDWQQFNLFLRGQKLQQNCKKAPRTCELIESIPKAAKCKRGQAKFSIMQPGTHVWAHTGPTNCRLRSHLGLVIPKGPKIRVGNETRKWKEGKVMIFDDSFEHEVWHSGDSHRIVLIVDFWHPELSNSVIKTLTPI